MVEAVEVVHEDVLHHDGVVPGDDVSYELSVCYES